jgi:outer membrane immunogenic protein
MSWLKLHFNASLHSARVGRVAPLRIVIAACSVLAAASADRAMAADWPLRGSVEPSYVRWDGWQFGLLAGYSNMTIPSNTTNGPVFGGFLGYNVQWDQLVVGFDLAYKYPSVLDSSIALSTFKLVDYATLRGRAGYAFGPFLPYAVLGIAVGRFNYADLDLVSGTFIGKDNAFNAGFVAGLGVDWAVTPSIFLRAEWEYIGFAKINGINATTNTGLVGGGVRF